MPFKTPPLTPISSISTSISEPEDFEAGPVDDTYVFFSPSKPTQSPQPIPETHSNVRIRSTHDDPESDGAYVCVAQFRLREFWADFTCLYHPGVDEFSEFEVGGGRGRDDVEDVRILFRGEELVGREGRDGVRDDGGNLFLFVVFGARRGRARGEDYVVGKRAVGGQAMGDVGLTEGELRRLAGFEGAVVGGVDKGRGDGEGGGKL